MTVVDRTRRANPFAAVERLDLHTFEEAAEIAHDVQEDFGKLQNEECSALRRGLAGMDSDATGRIPFSEFTGKRIDSWAFLEPVDYLRNLGVLDETDEAVGPKVLIPNYVASMSNCAETSPFFSVCCLDECGSVIGKLERAIKQPTATVEQIVLALEGVTTGTMEEPRNLSKGTRYRQMLEEV